MTRQAEAAGDGKRVAPRGADRTTRQGRRGGCDSKRETTETRPRQARDGEVPSPSGDERRHRNLLLAASAMTKTSFCDNL
jgi:hypothetical protein